MKLKVNYKRVFCPICNARICEGTVGSEFILKCPRCTSLIGIKITQGAVDLQVVKDRSNLG